MRLLQRRNFVIVKIDKKKQSERKEKQGSLFIVTDNGSEARNLQCGEIVELGANLEHLFPQAKIGDTAILHWFVESKEKDNKVFEDETFNYYLLTATECNGRVNELYGVWDGEQIIASPEYIFLEIPHQPKSASTPDEYIEVATKKTEGGLFVFDEWHETRYDKEEKMAKINMEIQSLAKTRMSEQLKLGIKSKEEELAAISADINKKCVEFYTVAAINPLVNEEVFFSFGHFIEDGDKVGLLNIAAQTTLTFMDKEYIIAMTSHVWCTQIWAKEAVANHRSFLMKTH
jgi:hypothetical protein